MANPCASGGQQGRTTYNDIPLIAQHMFSYLISSISQLSTAIRDFSNLEFVCRIPLQSCASTYILVSGLFQYFIFVIYLVPFPEALH